MTLPKFRTHNGSFYPAKLLSRTVNVVTYIVSKCEPPSLLETLRDQKDYQS